MMGYRTYGKSSFRPVWLRNATPRKFEALCADDRHSILTRDHLDLSIRSNSNIHHRMRLLLSPKTYRLMGEKQILYFLFEFSYS